MKFVIYNGLKFTRDDRTGYYLNTTNRKRLHRFVYETEIGEIPEGYQIHHIDHDKSNNTIENLIAVLRSEHASYHGKHRAENYYDEMVKNLNENARPKAIEWHKSEKGKEWHKVHYENMKDKLHEKVDLECEQCGDEFNNISRTRFCSNKCKSRWRRESGVDDEKRECGYCGDGFTINKYSSTKCCSKSCANRFRVYKSKVS